MTSVSTLVGKIQITLVFEMHLNHLWDGFDQQVRHSLFFGVTFESWIILIHAEIYC